MKQQTVSNKKSNQWLTWMFSRMTMFFGLGVLAAGTYVAKQSPSPSEKKFEHVDQHQSLIKHTTKLKSSLQAKLQLTSPAPQEQGDEFSLLAQISAPTATENINVKWVLPEGIELVSGTPTQTISILKRSEVEEVSVVLKQASDSNEQIHLKLTAHEDSANAYSQVLQYNSLNQDKIDKENANLRAVASEQMKKDTAIKSLQQGESKAHSRVSR